jgi:hypothetical protein
MVKLVIEMKRNTETGLVVMNGNWKKEIEEKFEGAYSDYGDDDFLDTIWDMSLTAFDIPREVQVVVDNKDNLYISVGTPGLVWFDEPPVGMSVPLKCWIHTHPFGSAYFSGTDWKTIKTWEPLLNEAVVLGDEEAMSWVKGIDHVVHFKKLELPSWDTTTQTKIDDWFGEEE